MSHPLQQNLPITTPSSASAREQNVRLTLVKVSCLMVTFETCHKGKISKCTWNFSPSLAADSFHSIFELPAAKTNSAALLPCRVPLANQSLPTTVLSRTMSELETRIWGSVRAGHLMLLSWWWSYSEQFWLLPPLPPSDQSKALHPHLSLIRNTSHPPFEELHYTNANVIQEQPLLMHSHKCRYISFPF